MGCKGYVRLLLFMVLLIPLPSWAVDIHGKSSTQFFWYNNDFNDQREVDVAQYLLLNVTNLDKDGKISFFGYGRGAQDLNNGNGTTGRLYYAYGQYRDLFDTIDLRMGRQFVNYGAGTAIVDGGQVELKKIGPVAFSIAGGRDVKFGLDGEAGHGGDMVLAMSAYLYDLRSTDLEVSWFRKWDSWDISRDVLGATFKHNMLNSVKVYANTRFDLVSETFNEILAGAKYFPKSNLIFTGEYYQSYPTFDTTSIFSVFAVNRYQEAVFKADYFINDMVSLNGGYISQWFGDGGRGHIYNVGCSVRPIEPLLINLEYDNNQGYNGKLNGFLIDAYYDVTKELQLSGGLGYDIYKRDIMTDDGIARVFWGGGKYKLAKNMIASLRVEGNVNERYSSDVRGRFIFDYIF
jgi:hypothetical protein